MGEFQRQTNVNCSFARSFRRNWTNGKIRRSRKKSDDIGFSFGMTRCRLVCVCACILKCITYCDVGRVRCLQLSFIFFYFSFHVCSVAYAVSTGISSYLLFPSPLHSTYTDHFDFIQCEVHSCIHPTSVWVDK